VALNAVSDLVAIVNRAGVVAYANAALEVLTGGRVTGLIAQRVGSLLVAADAPPLRMLLRSKIVERSYRGRMTIADVASTVSLLEVNVSAVEDAAGRIHHFCVLGRPLPVPAVAASASLTEVLGRLAAELAHDLNNQIAVVP
jgi:PAS domain-containing protein